MTQKMIPNRSFVIWMHYSPFSSGMNRPLPSQPIIAGSAPHRAVVINKPYGGIKLRLHKQHFKLNLEVDNSDWVGGADITYSGPFLSGTFGW
jgi:hypothetical protein